MPQTTDISRVTFKHNGKILCEYTPFQDIAEIRATIEPLAYEKGINANEIIAEVFADTESGNRVPKE